MQTSGRVCWFLPWMALGCCLALCSRYQRYRADKSWSSRTLKLSKPRLPATGSLVRGFSKVCRPQSSWMSTLVRGSVFVVASTPSRSDAISPQASNPVYGKSELGNNIALILLVAPEQIVDYKQALQDPLNIL
eukprot:jgi/Chlat1/3569/Chrsp234S03595